MRLRFEPAHVELAATRGDRVLDLADEHPEVGLPVACRAANCGSCLVEVRAGEHLLEPPAERERRELERRGAGLPWRLGCQMCIKQESSAGGWIVLSVPAG